MTRTRTLYTAAIAAVAATLMVACGTPSAPNETVTLTPAASESTGSQLDAALEGDSSTSEGGSAPDAFPAAGAAPGVREGALDDVPLPAFTDESRTDKLMSASVQDVLAYFKDQGVTFDGLRLESWSGEGINSMLCPLPAGATVGACSGKNTIAWNRAKVQEVVDTYGDLAAPYMAAQAVGVMHSALAGVNDKIKSTACTVGSYAAYIAADESYAFASDPDSSGKALQGLVTSINEDIDMGVFVGYAKDALVGYLNGSPATCFA